MAQLMMLFLLVVGTFGALTLLNMAVAQVDIPLGLRGRISLTVFFVFTGMSHFFQTEAMMQMLPPFVPMRETVIYITGGLEILGAVGLLIPRVSRLAAYALIAFLLGVLPANIYSSLTDAEFTGGGLGTVYLLARVPFQFFLIWWAYHFAIRKPV